MLLHHTGYFVRIGRNALDLDPVAFAYSIDHGECLLRQTSCLEREHARTRTNGRGQIHDHHALFLETGSDGKLIAEGGKGPIENPGCRLRFEAGGNYQSLSRLRCIRRRSQWTSTATWANWMTMRWKPL